MGYSRVVHHFGDTEYSQRVDLVKHIGTRTKEEAARDFVNNIVGVHQKYLEKHE